MKRYPWWVWLVAALVVAAAIAAGVLIGRGTAPAPDRPAEETPTTEPSATPEPVEPPDVETTTVRVYLARGEHLGVASREVEATQALPEAAVEQLLAGTTAAERRWGLGSEVPPGTRLIGLAIADGTARVDLSGEFASGGGSLSALMRLAQVVFTLTQFPEVDNVVLLLDGIEVDAFMGEGIVVSEPQTRADFEAVVPAILVEGPTPGDEVTSPIRVWGTANTFEASFMVRILDASGATIVEVPGMATSGSGTRGTFDMSVAVPDASAGAATVVVYESSAEDGSEINVVSIPVTPAP